MHQAQLILSNGISVAYTIHTSARAKLIRMRISVHKGLWVTRPQRVSLKAVKQWVNTQTEWVEKHWQALQAQKAIQASSEFLPQQLDLKSLGELWTINYFPDSNSTVSLKANFSKHEITISGYQQDNMICYPLLKRWLMAYAKKIFTTWLTDHSMKIGLRFNKLSIKSQRTRWGSCSTKKNINLNYKLLFFPAECVHYVMIHELCHTQQMNHSHQFWQLVAQFDSNYQQNHKLLKNSAISLPAWLNS